jgi:acyl-CoA oxidase
MSNLLAVKTGKAPNKSCDYLEDFFTYTSEIKLNLRTKEDLKNVEVLREILRYNVAFNVAFAG